MSKTLHPRVLVEGSTGEEALMKPGDQIRNKRVSGDTWVIVGMDRKVLRVRSLVDGTPALVDRKCLKDWEVVWTPAVGLEGLERKGRFLVRTDAPKPRVSLAGCSE